MTLRQRHTEGAILYEKKLKPFLKNLNDGKGKILRNEFCHSATRGQTRQHQLSHMTASVKIRHLDFIHCCKNICFYFLVFVGICAADF